jgi:hypothetical protein
VGAENGAGAGYRRLPRVFPRYGWNAVFQPAVMANVSPLNPALLLVWPGQPQLHGQRGRFDTFAAPNPDFQIGVMSAAQY